MILFCDLLKKNWFVVINFCELDVNNLISIILKIFEDWFVVINIGNDEGFVIFVKNFCK